MIEMHPFVEATKTKLRFSVNGQLSVEDLWDLPLNKLDEMAVAIDAEQSGSRKSFLANPDRKVTIAQQQDALRLEVLKQVIETKQAENTAKREAADKRQRKEFLQRLLDKKKIDQLESLSAEDIEKELAAMEA
jgi:siroheme synthase (precorrin-2 oxidase/ferrochelatase)